MRLVRYLVRCASQMTSDLIISFFTLISNKHSISGHLRHAEVDDSSPIGKLWLVIPKWQTSTNTIWSHVLHFVISREETRGPCRWEMSRIFLFSLPVWCCCQRDSTDVMSLNLSEVSAPHWPNPSSFLCFGHLDNLTTIHNVT